MDFSPIAEFIKSRYPDKTNIPLHEPRFVGNERAYVMDAIDSTYVSSVGEYVNRFERMMCEITGAKYAIATVNGTAALHLALLLAGVKRGDIVITQSLSFIATCNAISYIGAEAVFVDVDSDTMGLSPVSLKNWLETNTEFRSEVQSGKKICVSRSSGQRIAAVVPMHTFGHPVKADLIANICGEFNISMVEDAAESIGSYYKNQHTGTFGVMGTFSFNGNKTVTCGGGGAIVTNDESIAKRAKHLSTQAKLPHPWEFKHDENGFNYRMPNLNAALACAQLEQLDQFVADKRKLADEYSNFFAQISEVQFIHEPEFSQSNYWLNAILLNGPAEKTEFLRFTNGLSIATRPLWTLMHWLPMYVNSVRGPLTNSEYLANRLVNIPSSVRI